MKRLRIPKPTHRAAAPAAAVGMPQNTALPAAASRTPSAGHWPVCPTLRCLTGEQRRLAELCRSIRYGSIALLPIRDGQPDLRQPLDWRRAVKVQGRNAPHPGTTSADAGVPQALIQFFQQLAALGNGAVYDVQIRDGLPFGYIVAGRGCPSG